MLVNKIEKEKTYIFRTASNVPKALRLSFDNPLFYPAHVVEQYSFNPKYQPKNKFLKEVLSRITAIVAPIFFIYQLMLLPIFGVVDFILCIPNITSGGHIFDVIESTIESGMVLPASILEIPIKLLRGPNSQINLSSNKKRYEMGEYCMVH